MCLSKEYIVDYLLLFCKNHHNFSYTQQWLYKVSLVSLYLPNEETLIQSIFSWNVIDFGWMLTAVEHNAILKHDGLVNLISRNSYPCFLLFYYKLATKISYSLLTTKGYILHLEWMWKRLGNAWYRNVSEVRNWWFVWRKGVGWGFYI